MHLVDLLLSYRLTVLRGDATIIITPINMRIQCMRTLLLSRMAINVDAPAQPQDTHNKGDAPYDYYNEGKDQN